MKQKGDSTALFDSSQEVLLIRWKDNAEVTVLTNHGTLEPFSQAKRYDRKQKKFVAARIPQAIRDYNENMGGVDLHDNALANYRIAVRSKKWWWPVFTNFLGNMMVNAWKLHVLVSKRNKTKSLSQLEFRASVTNKLLMSSKPEDEVERDAIKTLDNVPSTSRDSRLPNTKVKSHFIGRIQDNKRKRCVVCHQHTPYICVKCNKSMHGKCFEKYSEHN